MHPKSITPHWLSVVILTLGLSLSGQTRSSELECGELKNYQDIGPWDYSDPRSSLRDGTDPMGRIKRVENVHFNPEMQTLNLKRFSIDRLTSEIHYTLRVFPNHPTALLAMSKLERMAGGKLPQRSVTPFTPRITADCFFDRAMRFRARDKAVRLVYGMHLQQRGKLKEALTEYELAESLGEQSANLYYNLGLLHADLKNWDKAFEYGDKAQRAGLMLPGLRGKLEKAGRPLPPLPQPEKVAAPDPASTPDAAK
jgi:hypothetical protein